MAEKLHPRRLQPQFQSCYKLSPTIDGLFHLLQVYTSNRDELVRELPTGFHVMDIFEHQLDQIVNLPSAANGKIYIFTHLQTYENGLHNCKTVDGSWEKQRLIYKEGDQSVQLATFHTKLKQRSLWSMELYTFLGQKIALCAIYNTNTKRKQGSSDMNGMLPIKRPRLDKQSGQENEHSPACHDLVDQVPTSFGSLFGGGSQGVGLEVDLPSSYLVSHLEYIAGSFNSHGVGCTGLLGDIVQTGCHQNIVTETVGLIKPTTEPSPIQALLFNIDDFNFGSTSSEISYLSVDTDMQNMEACNDNMEACNDMIEELLAVPSCDTGAGRLNQEWQTHQFPLQGFETTAF